MSAGLLISGCGGGGSSASSDTVAPTVVSVTPSSASQSNSATTSISVTFSEPVQCGSTGVFSVTESGQAVAGTVACAGSTLTFTPSSGLPTNTTLTATVSTALTDAAGNHLATAYSWSFGVTSWTVQFATSSDEWASALAIDSSGDVYLAGATTGSPDGQTNALTQDGFVARYDSTGVRQWTRLSGATNTAYGTSAVVDASGNVFLGGLQSNGSYNLPFIAKKDAGGTQLWLQQITSTAETYLRGLATDASGHVIAVGYTNGDLASANAGSSDVFVAKFDASGAQVWARQYGTAKVDNAAAVATDTAGNIYLVGYTSGGFDGHTSAGSYDIIVMKLDSDGVEQWSRQLGSSGLDIATAVALDASGNLYITGRTNGALDGNAAQGGLDAFVMKLDATGTVVWTRQFGSDADEYAYGLTVDSASNVIAVGSTLGAVAGNSNAGDSDVFIAKYDSSGTQLWVRQLGGAGSDVPSAVVSDASSNVYVAVTTNGSLDSRANQGGSDAFIVKFQADGTQR